jgi:hypothetical protein
MTPEELSLYNQLVYGDAERICRRICAWYKEPTNETGKRVRDIVFMHVYDLSIRNFLSESGERLEAMIMEDVRYWTFKRHKHEEVDELPYQEQRYIMALVQAKYRSALKRMLDK